VITELTLKEISNMAKDAPKADPQLDTAKLQTLTEPLTVTANKMKGNLRMSVALPGMSGDGPPEQMMDDTLPPGTGWSRNQVLALSQFVLTRWTGGGAYEFTVTDSTGTKISWSCLFDPRTFPERVAPNSVEAAVFPQPQGPAMSNPNAPNPPVGPAASPLGGNANWGQNYNGANFNSPVALPPHQHPQAQQQQPQPMQQPQQPQPQQQAWAQQPWGTAPAGWGPQYAPMGPVGPFTHAWTAAPQYPAPPASSRRYDEDDRARRAHDDEREKEKRELESRLRQAELTAKEMEYKAALERIQQQQAAALQAQQAESARQIQALQDEMRRLGEARASRPEDEEVRRMREEQQRMREQAAADAQAAREEAQRQREAAAAEAAALRQQIAEQQQLQMKQMMDQQVAALQAQLARMNEQPRGESDEVRRLRENMERQEREWERQRDEDRRRLEQERLERQHEKERFEAQRREEALAREMKEQAQITERRFAEMMAAQNSSKTDPMIDALKETARMSADQMREMARMQQANTDKMAAFMVAPTTLAQIMKDNSSGADVMMRNVVQTMSGIGDMYRTAASQFLEMSGGGGEPPAVQLLREGIVSAKETADRYMAMKRDEAIANSKVAQAKLANDSTRVQAEAHLRATAMQTQAPNRTWQPPPPVANGKPAQAAPQGQQPQAQQPAPSQAIAVVNAQPAQPTPSNGLSGADDREARANGHPAAVANGNATGNDNAHPVEDSSRMSGIQSRRNGPSEEEMFGVTWEEVKKLRASIAANNFTPEVAVDAILKGANYVAMHSLVVPAFTLFTDQRWADFVDILLPAAPPEFRQECVRILLEEVEAVQNPKVGDLDSAEATS
jgi:hypothetical protein